MQVPTCKDGGYDQKVGHDCSTNVGEKSVGVTQQARHFKLAQDEDLYMNSLYVVYLASGFSFIIM